MAYAYVHDVASSWVSYQAAAAELLEPAPIGLILHLAGATDEGVRCIDVWDSEEAGNAFRAGLLNPALERVGRREHRHDVLRHLFPLHVVLGRVPTSRPSTNTPRTTEKEPS